MLDHYLAKKSALLQVLAKVSEFAEKKGNSPAASLLRESGERLVLEQFTLVILGEFKRGKSTFINALLGKHLLPTAIVPLTAIPTVIQYGSPLTAYVVYLDGIKKEISAGEIADYVTEKGNPKSFSSF